MDGKTAKTFDKVDAILNGALAEIPHDQDHLAVTVSLLLNAVSTFAQMSGPELQKYWAEKLYGAADELAPGEPLSDAMRNYRSSQQGSQK